MRFGCIIGLLLSKQGDDFSPAIAPRMGPSISRGTTGSSFFGAMGRVEVRWEDSTRQSEGKRQPNIFNWLIGVEGKVTQRVSRQAVE